jgi:hypothetical protein
MLVIELNDGTKLEVPGVRRVRREDGNLHCQDEVGNNLLVLDQSKVVGYAIAPDPRLSRRKVKGPPTPPARSRVANG